MKKLLISLALGLAIVGSASAKSYDNVDTKYYKNSVYSILVNHTEQKFAEEIRTQFLNIPTPDLYYDHSLNVRVLNVSKKDNYKDDIDAFIVNNNIASRLVAKWFDRDMFTGVCSIDMLKNRGTYEASELDREMALRSARGQAIFEDIGEQLIGQTFVLVNEIRYIDHAQTAQGVGLALRLLGGLAAAYTGSNVYQDLGNSVGSMVETIKGFKVKIVTHLYQLDWNEEDANTFYTSHYSSEPDELKRLAFENERGKFKLNYVGKVESSGNNVSFMGINEEQPLLMVRKACQRALDENIADLQKKHDKFKVKSPVVEVSGNNVMACIGLKEGINPNSRYEVLEAQEKNGHIVYKQVAVVRPVDSRIWDNRYMAKEENAYGADFGATTFIKISGGEILPGHLLRQMN